jgi:serine/threonine protein kinase
MQGVLMPDRSLEVSRVGQYIGNYQLIRRLGKGGFAEVYLGQHLHLPRQVAIKLLLNSSLTASMMISLLSEECTRGDYVYM